MVALWLEAAFHPSFVIRQLRSDAQAWLKRPGWTHSR